MGMTGRWLDGNPVLVESCSSGAWRSVLGDVSFAACKALWVGAERRLWGHLGQPRVGLGQGGLAAQEGAPHQMEPSSQGGMATLGPAHTEPMSISPINPTSRPCQASPTPSRPRHSWPSPPRGLPTSTRPRGRHDTTPIDPPRGPPKRPPSHRGLVRVWSRVPLGRSPRPFPTQEPLWAEIPVWASPLAKSRLESP